jgi:hypothetical protein
MSYWFVELKKEQTSDDKKSIPPVVTCFDVFIPKFANYANYLKLFVVRIASFRALK